MSPLPAGEVLPRHLRDAAEERDLLDYAAPSEQLQILRRIESKLDELLHNATILSQSCFVRTILPPRLSVPANPAFTP